MSQYRLFVRLSDLLAYSLMCLNDLAFPGSISIVFFVIASIILSTYEQMCPIHNSGGAITAQAVEDLV
jgi:hypothetical protein